MAMHIQTGQRGEELAFFYLQKRGYKIQERNWRYSRYEIDLIAYDGNTLVFIEVKTRKSNLYGEPLDFVDDGKQKKIINAAEAYLHQIGHQGEVRFDIVSVLLQKTKSEIELIQDAFWSE